MRFLIYFFFCLSGAVALLYESLWSRYLKLFLGHSSYGQIITLITFMGGLGLGSFLAARFLGKVNSPFRAYARVELIAAIFGFAFHPVYHGMTGWFFENAATLRDISPLLANGTQIGICLLLTLPFATLLGMTFPLLATGMIRTFSDGGSKTLPTLYFTNSLGGAAGILLTSYYLVSQFGTHGSLQIAALGNGVIAFGFYGIHKLAERRQRQALETEKTKVRSPIEPTPLSNSPSRVGLWLTIAAGTGLASFIYEVGWIRLLSLILGSSTHSFDAMISAFILGLAFGGLFARRLIQRFTGDLAPVLGTIQVLMGTFAVLSIYLYRPFFDAIQASHSLFAKTEAAFPLFSLFKYLLALALMFPAAFCAGMTLPIITWRLVRETGRESYTGLVYGWNTIGSIVGAAIAGLFLMPVLQLKWTIFTGAALDVALGMTLLVLMTIPRKGDSGRRLLIGLRWSAVVLIAVALLPAFWTQFDPGVLVSGKFRRIVLNRIPPEIIAIRHGKTATISVGKAGHNLFIATNGKSDGAILDPAEMSSQNKSGDEGTVAELAILPMLTRTKDYDAAIIGMGTGMTGHYLLGDEKLKSLDLIEIEKAVIDLARYFRPRNERLWHDERLNIVIDDAKRHFYANRKEYDVIISEPSNPWVSGVASLFTKEFYQHIRHFLKPDGVLVQWLHGYEFRDDLFVSILSAMDSFEYFEIYRVHGNAGDYIVIASNDPIDFVSPESLAARSKVDEDLQPLGHHIAQFGPRNFIASSKTLRPILDEFSALANSDYYPYVEQNAETAFYTRSQIRLPETLTFAFANYAEILEPARIEETRKLRTLTEEEVSEYRSKDHYRQARDLLAGASRTTDWPHVEKLLLTATEHTAGSSAWIDEPLVRAMKQAVVKGIVSEPVALRFRFLEALSISDEEGIRDTLLPAVKNAGKSVLQEPFWIRTFLVAGIRSQQEKPVGTVMVEGVHENPRISPDERVLINSLVDRVIDFNPDTVAKAGED